MNSKTEYKEALKTYLNLAKLQITKLVFETKCPNFSEISPYIEDIQKYLDDLRTNYDLHFNPNQRQLFNIDLNLDQLLDYTKLNKNIIVLFYKPDLIIAMGSNIPQFKLWATSFINIKLPQFTLIFCSENYYKPFITNYHDVDMISDIVVKLWIEAISVDWNTIPY